MEDINNTLINIMTTDVIVGCGTNPKRPVDGEACKGLAKKGGLSLVLPIISAWNEAASIGKIYIVGPKKRLEDEISPQLGGIEKFVFVDEACQGDADALIDNIVKVVQNYKLTPFAVFSSCDMTLFSKEKAEKIISDIKDAMTKDYSSRNNRTDTSGFADLYFTIGMAEEDNKYYARKVDRPGAVFSKNEMYRFGSVHMFDTIRCPFRSNELKHLLKRRKVKDQQRELLFDCWDALGDGLPWFVPTANRIVVLKAISNYYKHYKKDIPVIPYFKVSFERVERAAYAVSGLHVTLVKTIGTDDIDNNEEFRAACQKKY